MRQILVDDNFYKLEFRNGDGYWKLKTAGADDYSRGVYIVYDGSELLGYYMGSKDYVVYDTKITLLSKDELQSLYFRIS